MEQQLMQPRDIHAEDCVKLMYMAGPHVFNYLFRLEPPEMLALLKECFYEPGTSYAKENMIAAVENDTVMGLILLYPVRNVKALEWNFIKKLMQIQPLLAIRYIVRGMRMLRGSSLDKTSIYIGYLAVFPEYRGRGIAGRLLMRAEEEARQNKLPRISLFVETDNSRARRVYEKFGFREAYRKLFPKRFQKFGLTGFEMMVKDVDARQHPSETPTDART